MVCAAEQVNELGISAADDIALRNEPSRVELAGKNGGARGGNNGFIEVKECGGSPGRARGRSETLRRWRGISGGGSGTRHEFHRPILIAVDPNTSSLVSKSSTPHPRPEELTKCLNHARRITNLVSWWGRGETSRTQSGRDIDRSGGRRVGYPRPASAPGGA